MRYIETADNNTVVKGYIDDDGIIYIEEIEKHYVII